MLSFHDLDPLRRSSSHTIVVLAVCLQYLEDDCSLFALDQGRLQPLRDSDALLEAGVFSPAKDEVRHQGKSFRATIEHVMFGKVNLTFAFGFMKVVADTVLCCGTELC